MYGQFGYDHNLVDSRYGTDVLKRAKAPQKVKQKQISLSFLGSGGDLRVNIA